MSASPALRSQPQAPRPISVRPSTRAKTPASVSVHPGALPELCDAALTVAVRRVARKYRLNTDQAEDLKSDLWLKLWTGHGRLLRRFRGETPLARYLTAVAQNLLQDQNNHHWGKWRPSAAARRFGARGIALDRLIRRDGFSVTEAESWFRCADPEADHAWIAVLAAQLPQRRCRRATSLDDIPPTAVPHVRTEDRLQQVDDAETGRRALAALTCELASLPASDVELLLHRYGHGVALADLAASSNRPAKPLYRHCEHLLRIIRRRLESQGLTAASVNAWIGNAH